MNRQINRVAPIRKLVALSEELASRVGDYRFGQRIGSESEALRRLIEAGLAAFEAKAAP